MLALGAAPMLALGAAGVAAASPPPRLRGRDALDDAWTPQALLFVTGLPRSGTTLLEIFLSKHGQYMLPLALTGTEHERDTQEFWPPGGEDYGGSFDCLQPMCGPYGYVSRAHQDAYHHDCSHYVERARAVRRERPEWASRPLPIAKHPGLTVGICPATIPITPLPYLHTYTCVHDYNMYIHTCVHAHVHSHVHGHGHIPCTYPRTYLAPSRSVSRSSPVANRSSQPHTYTLAMTLTLIP